MGVLICEHCGAVFDEADARWEHERDTGEGGYGNIICSFAYCPDCGSEDVSETVECPVCGELHSVEDDDIICNDCRKTIEELWQEIPKKLEGDDPDMNEVARYIAEVLA